MLVALWGALLTIAVHQGWQMPVWLNRGAPTATPDAATTERPPGEETAATADTVEDASTRQPEPPKPPPRDELPPPTARYRVCTSETPVLSLVKLDDSLVVAIHCGTGIHLVHLSADADPSRVALIALPTPSPSEHLAPVSIVTADTNADGRNDLLIPVLTNDAWHHAVGRHVLVLSRDTSGAFAAAQRVAAANPLAIVAGALDANAGDDFVVLHAGNDAVKKPRESWWFTGGNTPRRTHVAPVSAGSQQMVLADLDRDSHLDLVTLSTSDARLDILFGNGNGTSAASLKLELPGCTELLVADLSGDAHPDVLCLGEQAALIEARSDRELSVQVISLAGERVHSLQAADLNADGRLDLVGYAHPQLVRLERADGDRFEARLVSELRGTGFAPLAVLIADVNLDDALDLVMLGKHPSDPSAIDLAVVNDLTGSALFTVSDEPMLIADAPLMLRPALQ